MVAWAALERRLRSVASDEPVAIVLGGGAGGLTLRAQSRAAWDPRRAGGEPRGHRGPFALRLVGRVARAVALPRGMGRLPRPRRRVPRSVRASSSRPTTSSPAWSREHAARFERSFRFVVPSWEVMRAIAEQAHAVRACAGGRRSDPGHLLPGVGGRGRAVAATIRYPCLFKPFESALGRVAMRSATGRPEIRAKALIVHSPEELVDWFDARRRRRHRVHGARDRARRTTTRSSATGRSGTTTEKSATG